MEYMSTEIRSAREAMTIFKILGIKEITTNRQRKNGTQVFELPIQQMYQNLVPKPLRFATYKTGYVRNVSPYNSSSYQINKTKKRPAGTNGYHFEHVERILIQGWENRLIYLARFPSRIILPPNAMVSLVILFTGKITLELNLSMYFLVLSFL